MTCAGIGLVMEMRLPWLPAIWFLGISTELPTWPTWSAGAVSSPAKREKPGQISFRGLTPCRVQQSVHKCL